MIDGRASSSHIEVAPISDGREYIVRSGLVPGDTIIAEGVGLLREGTPVTPRMQPAAAPETATTETAKQE